jgi:4-diphosphocytidyl-2-C-methyl-D-erythritol kinase
VNERSAPEPVLLAAPAKLTLSLRMTGLRNDGLHLIEAEMISLDLCDTLELREGGAGLAMWNADGTPVAADIPTGPENLVNQALVLADRQASVLLTKRIPSQAGLGGGSSDAGAVLRWAGFGDLEAAAGLGADIAFCTVGGRARVSGIGEVVEPLPLQPAVYTLVTPPVPCPTGAIYRRWDDMGGPDGANGNDLEPAALAAVPELVRWRDELGDATGQTPRLAGSGSTWFVDGVHPGPGRVVAQAADPDGIAVDVAVPDPA